MAGRPTFIDLNSRSNSAAGSARLGLFSPRVQHYDGDIPPSLSPLDAFAAQSRKLAMELEAVKRNRTRRMSRLPPAHVSKSLSEHSSDRPRYFRTLSEETTASAVAHEEDSAGASPEVTNPKVRPISEYPRLSGILNPDSDKQEQDNFVTPMEHPPPNSFHQKPPAIDYFDVPRAESPEQSSVKSVSFGDDVRRRMRGSQSSNHIDGNEERDSNAGSISSHPDLTFTLAPPNSTFARGTNHMRTAKDGSDDDYASSFAGSTFSHARKLSSSSGVSSPHSPRSPFVPSHGRSPSLNSELSTGGTRRSKSNLNFSRPLSSTSLNKMRADSPSRRPSTELQNQRPYGGVTEQPPSKPSLEENRAEIADGFLNESATNTYAKFSLPRGRMVSRDSTVFQGLSTPHFEWQEPMFPSTPPTNAVPERSMDIPSPPPSLGRPSTSRSDGVRPDATGFSFDFQPPRPKTPDQPVKTTNTLSPQTTKSPASSKSRPSVERGESSTIRAQFADRPSLDDSQSLSSKSNSTVRPQTARTRSTMNQLSADEHVAKGIECHQHGDLKESTYHLRIAARENHPTGMLLYALACRHGWGMRANPKEGVQWLRRAMDSAMLEVADDPNTENGAASREDVIEKKARRVQFALSVYELGVSHLNGWGVEQDKALALRCFEIAGSWGDPDALTEAGFCYAEGIGCKKDLKKAAKFYRMADAKGVSMVGNSW